MKLIMLGAEVPSNRTLLESTGATHVGVSFWRLVKRGLPKNKDYLLNAHFKDSFYIYAYPGIPRDVTLTEADLEEFAAKYEDFIANNIDRINVFSEIAGPNIDLEFVAHQRKTVWSQVPPGKFLPVWDAKIGYAGLNEMAKNYLDIGIPGDSLETETQLAMVTRTLNRQHGTRFHVLGCAKPDNLRQVSVETASTMSWLSPMMNGETIVWDGTKLSRYPSRMKDQSRARYRNVYTKAGLDVDKILEDDPKEVCRLAVWSYLQYETRVSGMSNEGYLSDNSEDDDPTQIMQTTPSTIDNKTPEVRKLEARSADEMGNLPVFGYALETVVEEDGTIKDVTTLTSNEGSLRGCDTCFVASNCPAFKPKAVCAFKLPVSIKTKDQLKALINAMIEMQGQRVAFMRFAEEMNGGYADPNVSQEIDRLFKLIKTTKELDDSREFIRMTVERQGSAGVLSSIFGDKAQVLRELPDGGLNEAETTQIIKQSLEDK